MLTSGPVDEGVVRSRVRRLLERMSREGRLRDDQATVDVDLAMQEIFPSSGVLDETAYERYVDPSDRTMIYKSVEDAWSAIRAEDYSDLQAAMRSTALTARSCARDTEGLRAVFGDVNWSIASARYLQISARLDSLSKDIWSRVTTDYNLDADESFLGGMALFDSQHVHLLSEVVSDPLTAESRTTLLHEAAHLADESITDRGYYGTTGFEAKEDEVKITNAAHYEELPRRIWGTSDYVDHAFEPGLTETGEPLTVEEKIRDDAVEFYRRAWDAAADLHDLMASCRREQLAGADLDALTRIRLLEVSPLIDLTLHEQSSDPIEITRLDVATTESVARAVALAGGLVETLPVEVPLGPFRSDDDAVASGVGPLVDQAIAGHGGLLDDSRRDRAALYWLHSHFENVWP
jgi:hypothetical protein